MFASGLGQTNPALNTNYAGIAGQSVLAKVVIGVNNAGVPVVAAETMPGVVGVYMVTFGCLLIRQRAHHVRSPSLSSG
jgi:hypothetical protein